MVRLIQTILVLLLIVSCSQNKRTTSGLDSASIPIPVTGSQKPMPYQWIDKSTGHKIIRQSRRAGSERSYCFHNNPFINGNNSSDDLMIFYDALLFTIDMNSGKFIKLHRIKAWLNHLQFSPTNPNLPMYPHEGPLHFVDRIWNIDVTTAKNRLMHKRTMDMEIAGHEFFSRDGKSIFYDLQIPRGENFFQATIEIEFGKTKQYCLTRDERSIHYNISPDQRLFAGDGADSAQLAKVKEVKWIYLFEPSGNSLLSEKLVNMKYHSCRPLEPDVHFSSNGEWAVFKSDFDGEVNIYDVEIEKTEIKGDPRFNLSVI